MPRPKNEISRKIFDFDNENNTFIYNNGDCHKILKGHAGNLERHLKLAHPDVFENYIQKKSEKALNKVNRNALKLTCTVNKQNIEKAIVELFTKNGRPLRMTEDRSFKILTKPIFDAINIKLNEHSVMGKIVDFSSNLKQEVSKELKGKLLSLKIDSATRLSVSVLGSNVQYVSNSCIIIKTLGIKELKQRHTSNYLNSVLLEILNEYNININQIITITTDNGANMIKAVNDLKHISNTVDADNENSANNAEICMDLSLPLDRITSVRCGAHTLQLCVNDVLKTKDIKDRLENFRMIVKKLKTQTYLNLLRSSGFKLPILDCATRWNSTYLMLERLADLKDFINMIKADNPFFDITDESWNLIADFLNVFKIIYSTSKKLQSENLIYSDLYIQIMSIVLQLEKLPSTDLCSRLILAVNKRKCMLFDNDLFVTAIFLDPRIKVSLTAEHIVRAKNCIKQLNTRIFSLKGNASTISTPSSTENLNTTSVTTSTSSTTGDPLEAYLKNFDKPSCSEPIIINIENDLLIYELQSRLGINENIIEFWKKEKKSLTPIAYIVLAIPCTQVSVERLFSALKYILSDQRNKLTSTNLEQILLTRVNGVFGYDD